MYEFDYSRPGTLKEAEAALAKAEDGKALAGGMSLVPPLKMRLARVSDLVDLGAVDELRGISVAGKVVTIGAMTIHEAVADSPEVQKAVPALAQLAGSIGDPQVRHCGTLGGSICNNDPAADYPAAVLGLNATVYTTKREIAADDFFTGLFETALEEGELVTRVDFPVPDKAGLHQVPQPRFPLRYCRGVRRQDGRRRTLRGRGGRRYRIPGRRDRGRAGQGLRAFGHRGHRDLARRAQLRHPRLGRVPGAPRRRSRQAGRHRLRLAPGPTSARPVAGGAPPSLVLYAAFP